MTRPRFNVRTFLHPRDEEGHLIAKRVGIDKVRELEAASRASTGDDFWPVEVTEAEPARFRVKRLDGTIHPWAIRDRTAPHWLGHAATFEAAMRKIDDRVRLEHGMPPRLPITRTEVRERMAEHDGRDRLAEWYARDNARESGRPRFPYVVSEPTA